MLHFPLNDVTIFKQIFDEFAYIRLEEGIHLNDNDQKAEIVLADQMQFMLCEVVAEEDRKKKSGDKIRSRRIKCSSGHIYEDWGKPGH